MLRLLSGKKHRVSTGVALLSAVKQRTIYVSTDVYFRHLEDYEIRTYINSGEPFDKAGSYAIQGIGGAFVESISGCYYNVVGMPIPVFCLNSASLGLTFSPKRRRTGRKIVTYRILIKDLPEHERPRERLLQYGSEYLSNRELLAILLQTGTKNQSVFSLADQLISHFGSLKELACATFEEMSAIKGIGPAKAARILAAFELAKRLSNSSLEVREVICSPQDAADIVMDEMSLLDREHFVIIMLNTKHAVIAKKVVSIGHLNASLVHPRELFKDVIKRSSAAIILVHNHPSGDPTPSEDDIRVTHRLCEAGRLLGISVLDHIIVGDKRYVSFREQGLI